MTFLPSLYDTNSEIHLRPLTSKSLHLKPNDVPFPSCFRHRPSGTAVVCYKGTTQSQSFSFRPLIQPATRNTCGALTLDVDMGVIQTISAGTVIKAFALLGGLLKASVERQNQSLADILAIVPLSTSLTYKRSSRPFFCSSCC